MKFHENDRIRQNTETWFPLKPSWLNKHEHQRYHFNIQTKPKYSKNVHASRNNQLNSKCPSRRYWKVTRKRRVIGNPLQPRCHFPAHVAQRSNNSNSSSSTKQLIRDWENIGVILPWKWNSEGKQWNCVTVISIIRVSEWHGTRCAPGNLTYAA